MMENEEDHEIILHRDAHFSGNFPAMIAYYEKEGKGALLDLKRIRQLAEMDIPALDDPQVTRTQKIYEQLREIYSHPGKEGKLLADLILSEDEEEEAAVNAVVEAKITAPLIDLLNTPQFGDPLYPGYGQVLALAAQCLGKIGAEEGIAPLFEMMGKTDPHTEQEAISALVAIGNKAKAFLLKILMSTPITLDTENAALALTFFPEDPKIATACLTLLQDKSALKKVPLSTYLAIGCTALPDKKALQPLIDDPDTPDTTKQELLVL